ncbi:MAG: hypothetical protein CMG14_00200 [Candidatus Marinimicrobia bacterium]|nr:hypothetical protein [Candidatus Neomarinimicrobiota bacterium]
MKIKATASGKVFLTGEYMALEGGKAIILSTPQKARINLIENDFRQNIFTSSIDRKSYNFIVNDPSKINWLKGNPIETGSILEEAIRKFNRKFNNQSISIDTDEFFINDKKIGIGSSAAVSVALIKAFNDLFQTELSSRQIIDYAIDIHRKAQRSEGSGFDVVSSYIESKAVVCRLLEGKNYEYSPIEFPEEIIVLAVLSDVSIKTSIMIKRYQDAKKKNPKYFLKQAEAMKAELDHLHSSLLKKDSQLIIEHLRTYNNLLLDLDSKFEVGIFNHHHEMQELANSKNIFYKPSGAGGGDLGLMISHDRAGINGICEILKSKDINFFEI